MSRVYLDWNATAPLRPEARAAMLAAMEAVGNPSSVHAEGRMAKAIVEAARAEVAELVGVDPAQVIFTGSATEAAALAVAQKGRHGGRFAALATEHDCLWDWSEAELPAACDRDGIYDDAAMGEVRKWLLAGAAGQGPDGQGGAGLLAVSAANSETGLLVPGGGAFGRGHVSAGSEVTVPYAVVCDITQLAGKAPVTYGETRPSYAILSAHKLGGPKGVGALINYTRDDPQAILKGGGQEMGRRSGTENVAGIAGFGAAATAARADLEAGLWNRVAELRNILETALEASAPGTIFVGRGNPRLANTSCILSPGWKGETQVMSMDLAGFAISAGSACSSGKVKASRVLMAMGYSEAEAASAIRVSIGPTTTQEDIAQFVDVWTKKRMRHLARAA